MHIYAHIYHIRYFSAKWKTANHTVSISGENDCSLETFDREAI